MIKIYHSKRARSARVIWVLEELGIPYQVESMAFTPEVMRSPEYLRLHPLGQIPVMQDGAITMFESGAIVEYLLEKYAHGRLAPALGTAERAEYLQWFHYGEASLARHVSDIVRHRFRTPPEEQIPSVLAGAQRRFHEALAVVDRALDGRQFVCGAEFTAADIMIAYGMVMAKITRELPSDLPNISAYLARLQQRPSYERAWS
jgi:glutathione S-transferase